jgi:aspartate kinase
MENGLQSEIVVCKVGGSCLTSADALQQLLRILDEFKGSRIIFVASAFSGVTDKLLDLVRIAGEKQDYKEDMKSLSQLHEEISNQLFSDLIIHLESAIDFIRTCFHSIDDMLEQITELGMENFRQDFVISFGEKLSTFILAEFLSSKGLDGQYMPADQLIVTDDRFGNALPLMDFTSRKVKRQLIQVLLRGAIPCITGFIGFNKQGYTTTLGRGGSDFTASIIAACLPDAFPDTPLRVILWKNVDGILSASPEYISEPKLLEHISYAEAKELAYFGAKVLHPKCVTPLEQFKIPLEIRNFDKPLESAFTLVDECGNPDQLVKGVSLIKDVAMITAKSSSLVAIPGVLAKLFSVLGEGAINVNLVSQSSSEVNTTFCVTRSDGPKALGLLKNSAMFKDWFEFTYNDSVVVLGVIGDVDNLGVKKRLFEKLEERGITVAAIAQSADGLNISLVIDEGIAQEAIRMAHEAFQF